MIDIKCRPIWSLYFSGFGERRKWTRLWRGWWGGSAPKIFPLEPPLLVYVLCIHNLLCTSQQMWCQHLRFSTTATPFSKVPLGRQESCTRQQGWYSTWSHVILGLLTPDLRELRWLPITARVYHKQASLLIHKTLLGHTPAYIADLLTPVANIPEWSSLRASVNEFKFKFGDFVVPRTGRRQQSMLGIDVDGRQNSNCCAEL